MALDPRFNLYTNKEFKPDSKWSNIFQKKTQQYEQYETKEEKDKRLSKFKMPPKSVISELTEAGELHRWSHSLTKSDCKQKDEECVEYQPVIGILT